MNKTNKVKKASTKAKATKVQEIEGSTPLDEVKTKRTLRSKVDPANILAVIQMMGRKAAGEAMGISPSFLAVLAQGKKQPTQIQDQSAKWVLQNVAGVASYMLLATPEAFESSFNLVKALGGSIMYKKHLSDNKWLGILQVPISHSHTINTFISKIAEEFTPL